MKWVLVFLGSGLGGLLRLSISELTNRFQSNAYPIGTFLSNILACLILGLVLGWFETSRLIDVRYRLFLATGICGGFSTFSAFSNETLQLISNQKITEALIYVGGSLVFGIAAVFGGYSLMQAFK